MSFADVDNAVHLKIEQVNLLKHLLQKRLRIFIAGFVGCHFFWLRFSYKDIELWYLLHFRYGINAVEFKTYERVNNSFIASVIFLIFLLGYFIFLLQKKVIPLYKDVKHKTGVIVQNQIVRKSIPYNNRYFFFFDDLKISYKEVDMSTYYSYRVGDFYPILKSKYSETHIDEYLNIPLL